MIKVYKKWTTIKSVASKPGVKTQVVDATYNHETEHIDITTIHEEGVSFKNNTLEEAELKAKAVLRAIKFIKDDLNK